MAKIRDVVIDCRYPASLARFWAAALDGYSVAPYDEAELQRLRSLGFDGPEDDPTVLVEAEVADAPRIWLQQVPEPKVVKNRVHLDLHADDPSAEQARLVDLGARVLDTHSGLTVLADPEGNEFCLLH